MRPTVLIFDSGLGGLTVFREIMAAYSTARYVYVADDAFFPYGRHNENVLIARVVNVMDDLIKVHRPDLIVIACNTASTLVLPHLRERFNVPFVGTVPAIKPACAHSRSKLVSVLGTEATVRREYTQRLIDDYAQGCTITLVGASYLATLAEKALSGLLVQDEAIVAEIAPCFVEENERRTDAVVLACTHYPLLLDRLKRLAPWDVSWIDPAPAIARRVIELLGPAAPLARAQATFYLTSGREVSPDLAKALESFGFSQEPGTALAPSRV